MKFIIRNLGWILLIIFFVFMLYLISSQNNVNKIDTKVNTGSISKVKDINITDDNKIISNEISMKTISNEVEIESNTGSLIDSVRDFFTLEKKDSNLEIEVSEVKNIELKTENNKTKEVSIEDEKNTSTGGFFQNFKDLFTSDEEGEELKEKVDKLNKKDNIGVVDEKLIKKVDNIISKNEENNININKNKNITNENKIQKVAVKSIFLNNAYFTKRLYTAYKGDKLEQLTPTNKYGCFKVKVVSSKVSSNNGKVAWTCEYYMEGKTSTIEKFKKVSSNYYSEIKKFKTNSLHKVKVSALKLNNSNFTKKLGIVYKNDLVKQLTSINDYGCFKIKVISSKNSTNNGKIAWACKKYLK